MKGRDLGNGGVWGCLGGVAQHNTCQRECKRISLLCIPPDALESPASCLLPPMRAGASACKSSEVLDKIQE